MGSRKSIHAKTGTLNKVVALSGFVFGPDQQTGVSFSVIVSGISGAHGDARKRIDAVVLEVSDALWDSKPEAVASIRLADHR
jgi:D-alanyl-D-alanine carboxypeptidase